MKMNRETQTYKHYKNVFLRNENIHCTSCTSEVYTTQLYSCKRKSSTNCEIFSRTTSTSLFIMLTLSECFTSHYGFSTATKCSIVMYSTGLKSCGYGIRREKEILQVRKIRDGYVEKNPSTHFHLKCHVNKYHKANRHMVINRHTMYIHMPCCQCNHFMPSLPCPSRFKDSEP